MFDAAFKEKERGNPLLTTTATQRAYRLSTGRHFLRCFYNGSADKLLADANLKDKPCALLLQGFHSSKTKTHTLHKIKAKKKKEGNYAHTSCHIPECVKKGSQLRMMQLLSDSVKVVINPLAFTPARPTHPSLPPLSLALFVTPYFSNYRKKNNARRL